MGSPQGCFGTSSRKGPRPSPLPLVSVVASAPLYEPFVATATLDGLRRESASRPRYRRATRPDWACMSPTTAVRATIAEGARVVCNAQDGDGATQCTPRQGKRDPGTISTHRRLASNAAVRFPLTIPRVSSRVARSFLVPFSSPASLTWVSFSLGSPSRRLTFNPAVWPPAAPFPLAGNPLRGRHTAHGLCQSAKSSP